MPQTFQVLRCYKCLVFQVHQTKKSNKFECKMCGEKQSIKRHYGLGNGQECRKHVQKMNRIRGEIDESKSSQSISTDDENENVSNVKPIVHNLQDKPSKWSEYTEKGVESTVSLNSDDDKNMYRNDKEVVLELPKKRQKTLGKSFNRHQCTKTSSNLVQLSDYESFLLPKHGYTSSGSTQIANVLKNTTFTPPIKKEKSLSPDFEISSHSFEWASLDNVLANDKSNPEQTEISLIQQNNVSKKKFVPPAINKNSKWAKFTEYTDKNEGNEIEKPTFSQSNSQSESHALFSLCDDNDLDDYLTI